MFQRHIARKQAKAKAKTKATASTAASADQWYERRRKPDGSFGVFAVKPIPEGSRILSREPPLCWTDSPRHLLRQYLTLSEEQRREILAMPAQDNEETRLVRAKIEKLIQRIRFQEDERSTDHEELEHNKSVARWIVECFILWCVVITWAFSVTPHSVRVLDDDPPTPYQAFSTVFPEFLNFGHSCVPNVFPHWNSLRELVTVHALRDVKRNEELTLSYLFLETFISDSGFRHTFLLWHGVDCGCSPCREWKKQIAKMQRSHPTAPCEPHQGSNRRSRTRSTVNDGTGTGASPLFKTTALDFETVKCWEEAGADLVTPSDSLRSRVGSFFALVRNWLHAASTAAALSATSQWPSTSLNPADSLAAYYAIGIDLDLGLEADGCRDLILARLHRVLSFITSCQGHHADALTHAQISRGIVGRCCGEDCAEWNLASNAVDVAQREVKNPPRRIPMDLPRYHEFCAEGVSVHKELLAGRMATLRFLAACQEDGFAPVGGRGGCSEQVHDHSAPVSTENIPGTQPDAVECH